MGPTSYAACMRMLRRHDVPVLTLVENMGAALRTQCEEGQGESATSIGERGWRGKKSQGKRRGDQESWTQEMRRLTSTLTLTPLCGHLAIKMLIIVPATFRAPPAAP